MAAEFLVSGLRCPLAQRRRRGRCHVWLPGGGEAGEDGSGGGTKGSAAEPGGGGTVHGARDAGKPARCPFCLFVLAWACAMGVGRLPNSCTPLNGCQDITAYHRVRILFYLLGCMLKLLGISAFRVAFVYFDISP